MSVDKKELQQSIRFEVEYLGEPTGAFLWVTGGQTTRATEAITEVEATGTFQRGLVEFAEIEQNFSEDSHIAASRIANWENIGLNGETLPYSQENAILLVSQYDWIVEQIALYSGIVDSFIKDISEKTIEYAEWQFKYGAKQTDGVALKDHVEAAKKNPFAAALPQAQITQKAIEEESARLILPEAASLVWTYFIRLHQQRASGGMGLSCLSYSDIQAFTRLNNIRLFPWEMDLIIALDRTFLSHHYEEQERESKRASKK